MKPKTNPIYIPLAKVLLWCVVVVLAAIIVAGIFLSWCEHPCTHNLMWVLAEYGSTIVSACQTLAMIGMGVLGFHGFPRGRE